ncbi:cation:proton antiporter, partial [Candidatus Parcubacteria bacterium]
MEDFLFFEIAAVIITAGVIALIARLLKQPLIIAYIATGLLVGPGLLGIAESHQVFDALSEIGIAFLLFLVGLHLNWRNIRDVGKIAVMAGVGQIMFTAFAGGVMAYWLGFDLFTAALLGIAFAFSSTIIIVKVLSDKEDLDRFYGRISVGILIIQDIVAMLMLLGLVAFNDSDESIAMIVGISIVKMAAALFFLWLFAKFVLPHVFRYAAHSQELLFLIALSWC